MAPFKKTPPKIESAKLFGMGLVKFAKNQLKVVPMKKRGVKTPAAKPL